VKSQLFWEAYYTLLTPKEPLNLGRVSVNVQYYFLRAFWTLQPFVHKYLTQNFDPATHKLVFVGHSLGGAIASIAALFYSPANQGTLNPAWTAQLPKLYTFGMPRVGDYNYAKAHDQYVRDSWRVTHNADLVPHLPWCEGTVVEGIRFCTMFPATAPYHHGNEIWYNNQMTDPLTFKQCNGIPINEDKLCSNLYPWVFYLSSGIPMHTCYFGRLVGQWCELGDTGSLCSV